MITDAQRVALKVLSDGEFHDSTKTTHHGQIHGGVAKALVKAGLATTHAIVEGREIWGIDLIAHLGQWRTQYRITDYGREALKKAKRR
jgi:hypothetical protein